MLNRSDSRLPRALAAIVAAGALCLPAALRAQGAPAAARTGTAEPARPLVSMGQPQRWQPYLAAGAAFGAASPVGVVGVYRSITNPVTGLLGAAGEAYASDGAAGGRLLATSRALALGAGLDWRAGDARPDLLLSYQTAVRRGGLLGHGTMLRVDWLPGRDGTVIAGVTLPLWARAGETRTRRTDVALPGADPRPAPAVSMPPAADAALAEAQRLATLLRVHTSLYTEGDARLLRASREGWLEVERGYHRALADAFAAAVGDARRAGPVTDRARAGLLEDVLLPYDRALGRVRGGAADFRRLAAASRVRFDAWLRDSSGLAPAARDAASAVHARWLGVVERVHADALAEAGGDSRTVWLPLQLALRADEYDEQAEVDSLVARAVGRPFTDRNALAYLRSGDLPLEIARSIYAARDYHVLWMHDFAGRRERTKRLDAISYEMVADAYLPALAAAVRRYDSTGVMPAYLVLLDQYFYEPRAGRIWMTILEDPLGAAMRLPRGNAAREAHLRERQAELRAAVAASARLQREARANGGERWLRRVVKVHVSVTQPSDFSFRSHHIVPGVPFTPDNVMRDHRKIVFYDLNEADPYRGALLLMGVGVGEHYASATWEDRGWRVRGPAALEARDAVRRLLVRNGFAEDDVPPPLRAMSGAPPARATERAMDRSDYVGRALQVHNEVGFGPKQSSVARALLYTLAEPGSIVVVPDPLWVSREWAGMLAAAAVRGARVQVIAPALANAPSPQAPLMALSHDVMARLLALRDGFGPRIAAAGGALRVGLFASTVPVDDAEGRRREIREGLARAPWIRELVPFDERALAVLSRATTQTAADPDATDVARDERPRPPQLHQKTQLVARPGAVAALARQPGWEDALAAAMEVQSRQTARFAEQLGYVTPAVEEGAARGTDAMFRGYEQSVPEAERRRVSFYFVAGTQNQDPRGLMLDGEATLVTSGFSGAAGLVDLYFLMARTTWVGSVAELDRLLPPKPFWLEVARVIRPTL